MSLARYKQKRSFDKTPEPTGGKPSDSKLHFVVQKHHASHLHYDFRLEMEGVLKSWAVPKGPSMNPEDKRLAMMVEDHPWDYRKFEGIIPSGYGAGTVIVWDEGTYEPIETKRTKKENEKELLYHLYKGSVTFILKGKKLKGEFSLVKTKDRGENAWLLIKKKDKYAGHMDITQKDRSVLSNKTLEEVAAYPEREWKSHRPQMNQKYSKGANVTARIKTGHKSPMPATIKPMLCTLIKEPFNDEAWLYEVKWDGYRIIAFIRKGKVMLKSRGNQDYTAKYPPVATALKDLSYDTVIDGEVVVLDKKGNPDFSALQNYKEGDSIAFYVFDLLWCNGYNIMTLELSERKDLLKKIVPQGDVIKYSESFDEGNELFNTAKAMGIEGIVAKKRDSIYTPGRKGNTWYKIKLSKRQEYVIGGWTESDNRRLFRSLIFGHYVNGQFTYVHHSGGGFTEKQMKELSQKLKKLEIKESPFINEVDIKTKKHWARPVLVAEFDKSTNTTATGKIRHPAIFVALREDKKANEVIEELPGPVDEAGKSERGKAEAYDDAKNEQGSWETLDKRKVTSENELVIEGRKINLINIERELWPGVNKAKVIEYYISMADFILPQLKDRPLGLNICMNSAAAGGFFIRGMEGRAPGWAKTFTTERRHKIRGRSQNIEWLVCNNTATLVYIINLESIDIHPWASRITSPNEPDYIVIDLDPSDDDFKKAIETARAAREFFNKNKLKSFIKTSGKTGLHLLVPCTGIVFGDARNIAETLCSEIHDLVPDITTTNVSVSSRGELLYIDPNQNDYADRVASAYCLRAYHSPTVSTPLDWNEVNTRLKPADFNIDTIAGRLKKKGDLFEDLLNKKTRAANSKILRRFL